MIKAYSAWGLTLHAGVRRAAVERLHPLQADMRKCGPDAGAPPPSAFLERLMEAFRQFTHYDPSSEEHKATVTVAFIDQSSRDIRKKLQKLEGL